MLIKSNNSSNIIKFIINKLNNLPNLNKFSKQLYINKFIYIITYNILYLYINIKSFILRCHLLLTTVDHKRLRAMYLIFGLWARFTGV